MYAAQVIPPIDAEIAEKGHLWTEISLDKTMVILRTGVVCEKICRRSEYGGNKFTGVSLYH